jgi:hypothetical protein
MPMARPPQRTEFGVKESGGSRISFAQRSQIEPDGILLISHPSSIHFRDQQCQSQAVDQHPPATERAKFVAASTLIFRDGDLADDSAVTAERVCAVGLSRRAAASANQFTSGRIDEGMGDEQDGQPAQPCGGIAHHNSPSKCPAYSTLRQSDHRGNHHDEHADMQEPDVWQRLLRIDAEEGQRMGSRAQNKAERGQHGEKLHWFLRSHLADCINSQTVIYGRTTRLPLTRRTKRRISKTLIVESTCAAGNWLTEITSSIDVGVVSTAARTFCSGSLSCNSAG